MLISEKNKIKKQKFRKTKRLRIKLVIQKVLLTIKHKKTLIKFDKNTKLLNQINLETKAVRVISTFQKQ